MTPRNQPISTAKTRSPKSLKGLRILSLALNLPGPAALMRCRELGASCKKIEPLRPGSATTGSATTGNSSNTGNTGITGDPMSAYSPKAYAVLHQGIRVITANLKLDAGQRALQRELARSDVLLTSFRPTALTRFGLDWKTLHRSYPGLSQVAIVGGPGALAEQPGHDLTYLAENDLITGLDVPATLYADMGGALMAVQAVLQAALHQRASGKGVYLEVPLSSAAAWLALPRSWGLTTPGAAVGGGHAGYRVYACQDGRVAVAALEPHFAARLCVSADTPGASMHTPATHDAIARFFRSQTRKQLDQLAADQDIPLQTLAA
ncbi:MAG: CoA transferase [Polaromonas sp.]|nr:CoA transferase [Polaromonas sp.]